MSLGAQCAYQGASHSQVISGFVGWSGVIAGVEGMRNVKGEESLCWLKGVVRFGWCLSRGGLPR